MFVYLVKKQVNDLTFHVYEIKRDDIRFVCIIPYKMGSVGSPAHQFIMDEMIKLGKIPVKFKGMKWDSPEFQRYYTFKHI